MGWGTSKKEKERERESLWLLLTYHSFVDSLNERVRAEVPDYCRVQLPEGLEGHEFVENDVDVVLDVECAFGLAGQASAPLVLAGAEPELVHVRLKGVSSGLLHVLLMLIRVWVRRVKCHRGAPSRLALVHLLLLLIE